MINFKEYLLDLLDKLRQDYISKYHPKSYEYDKEVLRKVLLRNNADPTLVVKE